VLLNGISAASLTAKVKAPCDPRLGEREGGERERERERERGNRGTSLQLNESLTSKCKGPVAL